MANYWFYLVRHGTGVRPQVDQLRADEIAEDHLAPTHYVVGFGF